MLSVSKPENNPLKVIPELMFITPLFILTHFDLVVFIDEKYDLL